MQVQRRIGEAALACVAIGSQQVGFGAADHAENGSCVDAQRGDQRRQKRSSRVFRRRIAVELRKDLEERSCPGIGYHVVLMRELCATFALSRSRKWRSEVGVLQ